MVGIIIYYSGIRQKKRVVKTNHICSDIVDITNEKEIITIQFKNSIQYYNPINLSSYFGYYTSIFDLPLLMPPGSAYKASITNNTLKISFPIPFISNFNGIFFCADNNNYEIPPFQLPLYNQQGIIYEKPINISVLNFRSDFDDTQILCHGNSSENRWCEAFDIGMAHGKLIMQTKAHFEFPSFFLSLCGRSPPFDNESERITYEPLLTKKNIAEISVGHVTNNEVAILASPCSDRMDVFNVIFDFLIPAYQTIRKSIILNIDSANRGFRFYFRDSENKNNIELIQSITKDPPNSPPNFDQLLLFDRAILGIEKADEECDGTRSIFTKYGHIYKFNQENTQGFREEILNYFGIKQNDETKETIENSTIKSEVSTSLREKNKSKNGDKEDDVNVKLNDNDEDNSYFNAYDDDTYFNTYDDDFDEYFDLENNNNQIKKKKALITFFDTSKQERMKLFNIEPLKRLISRSCSFCDVRTTYVDTPNISSLIEIAASSSVLIARSGIGLEHSVWLKNNSHVIELRPFGFWCDDRYEVAANISGSHYHSVMNKKLIKPFFHNNLNEKYFNDCLSAPSYCESQDCYQTLLKQRVDIELNTFNNTWFKIQLDLQKKIQ